jgi:effector-binding domain-containing protein
MDHQPEIVQRQALPYAAVAATVTMANLATVVGQGIPELFEWLSVHSIAPVGAPFVRYLMVEMDGEIGIEIAVPVSGQVPGDKRIQRGDLPGGRYATLLHVGPYDELIHANAIVQRWGHAHGLQWAMNDDATWAGRIERHLTDPSQRPDPSQWQTEIAYLIDDESGISRRIS